MPVEGQSTDCASLKLCPSAQNGREFVDFERKLDLPVACDDDCAKFMESSETE
jgi:hypothetical protein